MTNSTDALFRAWVQFIDDTLVTTGGWVNTTDTGQMTIASATHPSTTSTKVGYRVYHMADALQSTAPVFVRIDYGSGASANNPVVWLTIGTGSDGAGNITGVRLAATEMFTNGSATSVCNSYGSADTNRFSLLMFIRNAGDALCVTLERSKDATGADTADGLLLLYSDSGGAGIVDAYQYLVFTGANPPLENGLSIVLANRASSAFNSNVGIGLPIPFKGYAQPPGLNFIAVNDGDFLAEATVTTTIYGTAHSYQLSNTSIGYQYASGNGGKSNPSNRRIGIRYE